MTPVGHTLAGLAIGYAVLPQSFSTRAQVVTLATFAVLANAPDLPIPGWGHDRYHVSHSVFVTTLGVVLVWIAAAVLLRGNHLTWPLLVGGAVAWYSHLLLDSFYNHGKGLAVLWPFSDRRLALPLPWFSTMKLSPIVSWHNLKVFAIEAAAYGMLLGMIVLAKAKLHPRLQSDSADATQRTDG